MGEGGLRSRISGDRTEMTQTGLVVLESIIRCPVCGWKTQETMPTDACQWAYQCQACNVLIKPKAGDCCVYCSDGTEKRPPVQQSASCYATGASNATYFAKHAI